MYILFIHTHTYMYVLYVTPGIPAQPLIVFCSFFKESKHVFTQRKSGSLVGVSYFERVVAHAMSISIAYLLAWQNNHFILKLPRWTK